MQLDLLVKERPFPLNWRTYLFYLNMSVHFEV